MKTINKIFLILIFSLFFWVDMIFATSGIGIRPLRTSVSMDPGQTKEILLTIINNENFSQTLESEFQTYISHDKSGYPVAKNITKDDPRNIISWIDFGSEKIVVKAKSEKLVKIKISVPKNAEPGGRYGALIYGPVISKNSGVSFRARVASLILLQVKGDEKYDGEISNFEIKGNKIFSDKSITFAVDFKNKGNLHVNPKGSIGIHDNNGNKILSIFSVLEEDKEILLNSIPINSNASYALPGFNRVYESNWDKNIKNGKYVAKLDFVFKKNNKESSEKKEIEFEIKDQLDLINFDFVSEEKESFFVLEIENTGTVYERIKGSIDILNEFNLKIAEIKIPEDVEYISPGQSKKFKFKFLDKKLPDGEYSTKSNVFYGHENKKIELNNNFGKNNNIWIYLSIIGIIILVLINFVWLKKMKK